ncbi:MAG: DUF6688 family protein, partial [Pseudomonadota bacterium]
IIMLSSQLHFHIKPILIWTGAVGASMWLKYIFAVQIYESLPAKIPQGYGDCFIVSAAAKGHKRIVGSRVDSVLGQPVNQQLRIFRAFEIMLMVCFPGCHQALRRFYNKVGPRLAKRIRHPWQADLVYLLLKPFELTISGYFLMSSTYKTWMQTQK